MSAPTIRFGSLMHSWTASIWWRGVRSSRRLEAEVNRNIELIWLLGGLKPDFKTIADFRRDNRAAFRSVFREFVVLCRRLDLFGRELIAVDETRIKAVNNKDRNFTKGSLETFIAAADKKLEDYLKRLDAGDAGEQSSAGWRVKNLAEKIASCRLCSGTALPSGIHSKRSRANHGIPRTSDVPPMARLTRLGIMVENKSA
jgi:hypothetical protein